jgi:minor extracellular serine protease Vpr
MKTHRDRLLLFVWLALAPALVAATVPGRYIVELTTEPVAQNALRVGGRAAIRGTQAAAHRTLIRQEQAAMRRAIEQNQAIVLDSVDTVANALFVEAPDAAAAAQIASLAGVKRVLPERTFHMVLDRVVVLHKVEDAWNRIGIGNAGSGVKIAIIDSGIDSAHPGFQDADLQPPDSYPRTGSASDLAYTSNKVIVARSYVYLVGRDPDNTPRDHVGHGTALAMAAAGVRNAGPMATITGMAPKAYLGNYKVFGTPGYNDGTTDSAILKALDDAVADGMDIISLSLGSDQAPRLSDDVEVEAVERAHQAGVLVVIAAGNDGPGLNTVSSPGTAPSAITVGASTSDRTFAASAELQGLSPFVAIPGDGAAPAAPISAAMADVAALDGNGLACSALPARSLEGRVALILRGTCTFEIKLNNAQAAGAVAGLVYATELSPDAIHMSVGSAGLPAEMISNQDGVAIKQSLAAEPGLAGTLRFSLGAVPVPANRLTDFSAAGPNVDNTIKPDLVAVGDNVYTATQTLDANGDMYDPSGYILVDGTSFSTPIVAGVAALVKSARPGLTPDQYRSLVIDTAAAIDAGTGPAPGVQQTGAGLLDADAALRSTIAAYPASLGLGAGGTDPQVSRSLTLSNVGGSQETLSINVVPQGDQPGPAPATNTVELAPGASAEVALAWTASGLAAGAYQGYIMVSGASSGTALKIPYWYAVASGTPAGITVLDLTTAARRGRVARDAVLFRVVDSAGLSLADAQPEATVVSGDGAVRGVVSYDSDVPGMFGLDVQLGLSAGPNVYHIQAGAAALDIVITGQ